MKFQAIVFVLGALCVGSGFGAVIADDFAENPTGKGWRAFGETSLFRWNGSNQNLEVAWDSSRSNGFFYLPVGTILSKNDDFSVAFDVRLKDVRLGATANKTNTFEIAIGFLNSRTVTNANYFRGAGQNATYGVRNLVEFDYFPDSGFGATFATTVVSTNNRILPVHNFPLEMTPGDLFRITLAYTSSNKTLRTSARKNGTPFGLSPGNTLGDLVLTSHPDFRVDAFGVSSYSDAIQTSTPDYWGSILAHGVIDNVVLTVPEAPLPAIAFAISNSIPQFAFMSRTNWNYSLQRSLDAIQWDDVSLTVAGNGGSMILTDSNALAGHMLYRVRLERP